MAKNLKKRGNVWYGRIQIKGREKEFTLGTGNLAEARKRLRLRLDELEAEQWGEKPRRTFDEAAIRFMDEHFPHLKTTTRRRYEVSLIVMEPHFTGKHLDDIKSAALYEFELARRQEVTPSTIMKDLTCLSSLYSCAQEWEWVDHNPVPAYKRGRKRTGLKEGEARTRYLTAIEEERLLDAIASRRVWEMIVFAIDTGLRRNEQFSLTSANVDLRRNRIIVTPDMAKSGKRRVVPLLPRAREIVIARMADMRSPYIFATEAGGRYSPNSPYVWESLQRAAKRASIPPLRWHDLRRTCGCRLLQSHGLSMKEVCEWLGHSSSVVTERAYAFLGEDALQEAISRSGREAGHGKVVELKERMKNSGISE